MPVTKLRYDDTELSLIKNAFSEQDELLTALQKAFLQLPLSAVELSLLQAIKGKELLGIIKKVCLPEITDDTHFSQIWDYTLGIDFKNKLQEQIIADIKSNKIVIDYLKQQLKVLEKQEFHKEQKIKLAELEDIRDKLEADIYVETLARNNIIGTVNGRMSQLYILAGGKEETPEQMKKRLTQDSTK